MLVDVGHPERACRLSRRPDLDSLGAGAWHLWPAMLPPPPVERHISIAGMNLTPAALMTPDAVAATLARAEREFMIRRSRMLNEMGISIILCWVASCLTIWDLLKLKSRWWWVELIASILAGLSAAWHWRKFLLQTETHRRSLERAQFDIRLLAHGSVQTSKVGEHSNGSSYLSTVIRRLLAPPGGSLPSLPPGPPSCVTDGASDVPEQEHSPAPPNSDGLRCAGSMRERGLQILSAARVGVLEAAPSSASSSSNHAIPSTSTSASLHPDDPSASTSASTSASVSTHSSYAAVAAHPPGGSPVDSPHSTSEMDGSVEGSRVGICHPSGVGWDQQEEEADDAGAGASRIFQRLRVQTPWHQPESTTSQLAASQLAASHLAASHLAASHLAATSVATHCTAAPAPSSLASSSPARHTAGEPVSLADRLCRLSKTLPASMTPAQLDCILMPPPPSRPSKLQRTAQPHQPPQQQPHLQQPQPHLQQPQPHLQQPQPHLQQPLSPRSQASLPPPPSLSAVQIRGPEDVGSGSAGSGSARDTSSSGNH